MTIFPAIYAFSRIGFPAVNLSLAGYGKGEAAFRAEDDPFRHNGMRSLWIGYWLIKAEEFGIAQVLLGREDIRLDILRSQMVLDFMHEATNRLRVS
jgi:hypothetical protein